VTLLCTLTCRGFLVTVIWCVEGACGGEWMDLDLWSVTCRHAAGTARHRQYLQLVQMCNRCRTLQL
jgi:hypothetical protein